MELVKRNIVSIIFGVIALIALVALFVPLGGMQEEFHATLAKQAQLDQNIRQLLSTPRMKPVTTPGGQPEPLEVFPSRTVIELAKGVTDDVRNRSVAAMRAAEALNKRDHHPLMAGALPTPANTPVRTGFRAQYNACVTPGGKPALLDPAHPEYGPRNIPDDILKAVKPPTDDEIKWALYNDWKQNYEPRILTSPPPPGSAPGTVGPEIPQHRVEIVEEFRKKNEKFAETFRSKRSSESPIYLGPGALSPAQNMDPKSNTAPSEEDMWYAQVTLWVQQDVALAIAAMNKDSKSVLTSPVKHLGVLDVKQGFAMYELPVAEGSYGAAAPAAPALGPDGQPLPAASAEGEIPKFYPKAFTGRVCNPMYDVVHFKLVAVVDAQHVRRFLQMLEYGKFVTVLNVDIKQEDLELRRQQGYDYGSSPVVEVSLTGEALFLREWTAHANGAPMPADVKKKLGVQPKASDGSAPPPTVAAGVAP